MVLAMIVSYFFVLIGAPAYIACVAGFSVSMAAGAGKEYGDKLAPGNIWDWYDIIADTLGALVGCFCGFIPPIF